MERSRLRLSAPHVVALLLGPAAPIVELAIPMDVFGAAPARASRPGYEVRLCTAEPGPVPLARAVSITTAHGLADLAEADTVFVIGGPAAPPAAIRAAHARGARVVGVGSGVLALARAGLLDGRRAVCRTDVADDLRRRHPAVQVDATGLYTSGDDVITCAGGSALLDLCLGLVRRDHGVAVAHAVARTLVAPPHRAGDQTQVVVLPFPEQTDRLAELLDWIRARLDQPLTLGDLAAAINTSPRTLARRFHATLGTTPIQWLLSQRIEFAQHLLETTLEPIEHIAKITGLGSPSNFRRQFTRATGSSPRSYRRRFAGELGRS
ncbi:MAG: GlxA family transcriptional regulator [Pseudonocardia sp.]